MLVRTLVECKEVNYRHVDSYLLEEIFDQVKQHLTDQLECKTLNEDEPIHIHVRIDLNFNENGNTEI